MRVPRQNGDALRTGGNSPSAENRPREAYRLSLEECRGPADDPNGAALMKPDTMQDSRPDRKLSRKQRIASTQVFKEAFDAGSRYVGNLMVVWLRKGDDACLRLGVVASKKSFRRAVDRNRAKRLLREAYRLNRFRFHGKFDVVIVARARILDVKRQAVDKDLLTLAAKAGILGEDAL
jgi:ribonuclease P protein component